MKVKALAIVAVALAGAVGTTFAEARDNSNVQFSVQIGQPVFGAWVQPVHDVRIHRPYGGYDRDHDGIPNRYDRHYNPRGDRDRDGIPNYRDPNDTSRWNHHRGGAGVQPRWDRY